MKTKKLLLSLVLLCGAMSASAQQSWDNLSNTPTSVYNQQANVGSSDATYDLYLYNVGANRFLDRGGRWGTQSVIGEGTPLKVLTYSYRTGGYGPGSSTATSDTLFYLQTNQWNYNTVSNGTPQYKGLIEFTDSTSSTSSFDGGIFFQDQGYVYSNGYSKRTTALLTFEQISGTNQYRIKTTANNSSQDKFNGTFYMCATGGVTGDGLLGVKEADLSAYSAKDYDKWILVTSADFIEAFKNTEATNASPAICTFLITDGDFARNDKDGIGYWKDGDGNSAMEYNTAHVLPANQTETYFVGNGYTEDADDDIWDGDADFYAQAESSLKNSNNRQKIFGGDWTCNIHGAEGIVAQTVTVPNAGWYVVGVSGLSTDGSGSLFAAGITDGTRPTVIGDDYQEAKFTTVDAPSTYVQAARLLQGTNASYKQSVLVYVKEGTTMQLSVGVRVTEGTSDSWTCFDNFTVYYVGDTKDLILSETETSIDYINAQVNTENAYTLRLNRSFNVNNWNSLVLPVSLTTQQVTMAFGGDTKLSKLSRYNGRQIVFDPVDLSTGQNTAIEAGKLYIIKPQTPEPTSLEKKSIGYGETKSDGKKDSVSVTNYYTINQIALTSSLQTSEVKDTIVNTGTADGSIQHVGTYVAINSNAIPANTYVLGRPKNNTDGKTRWYWNTVNVNKVKGFRGWIATNFDSSSSAKPQSVVINGVEELLDGTTTSIDGIAEDAPAKAGVKGVYTLGGQKVSDAATTDGLAKGLYIIDGKKVVVK